MLFNSHLFLLGFLPFALALYGVAGRTERGRVLVLLGLSLVFYGWWDPRFLLLLLGGILLNWAAARAYVRSGRRGVITAAIVLDLAVLGLFKYSDFLLGNVAALAGGAVDPLGFALPLGISFFTFHHIMYLADLRRGRAKPTSLERYALYICFFPQAIAGPLSRWSEVGGQFGRRLAHPGWERRAALATVFIVLGLVEKVALGDPLGRLLDPVYAAAAQGRVADGSAWFAPFFALQIFFDFAGYSDIAIGVGLLFGVELPFNFDAPFRAASIIQFWSRWHVTLARLLRDYVFMPLADLRIWGWRHTAPQYVLAVVATMTLCGLWHGAGWNFLLWGLLQGVAMVVALGWRRGFGGVPGWVGWVLTVGFFLLSSVLFRAGSLAGAWNVYASLGAAPGWHMVREFWLVGVAGALAVLLPASRVLAPRVLALPAAVTPAVLGLAGLAILIQLGGTESYDFIYFAF